MPTQIQRIIAIGEMTRLLRNTEKPLVFKNLQNKLIKHFARRKYPKEILKEIKGITHNKRLQLLEKIKVKRYIERPLPFVTTYARYTPALNKVLQAQ